MTCHEVLVELDAYRRGELPAALIGAIDRHLAGCGPCRRERDAIVRVAAALAELPRIRSERRLYPASSGSSVAYATVDSPIGPLQVAFRGRRICSVDLSGKPDAEVEARLARRFGRPARRLDAAPAWVPRAIDEAFAGRRARYLPIDLEDLGPFDRAVLEKAREIPPGEFRTYAWIAREIGHPGAVRAVGTALGNNPVPFLVPCHRVLRSDLTLGGYAFGPDLKQRLLEREGLAPDRLARLAAQRVRFTGSRTTKIFCFPTCYTGHRMKDHYRVLFHSAEEARAAGYRPCKVCRPAAPELTAS